MPRLSVVIPTRNRPASLTRTVDALIEEIRSRSLDDAVELLVVDDASELPVELERRGADLRVVRQAQQRGASAARNAGVEASRGALLAFLDDDIVPHADYLSETLDFHDRHPDALVANGNLRALRDDIYSRFWFHLYDATFNRAGEIYPVPMLASGHSSMKRRVLEFERPLFDPQIPAGEDLDLYLRLRRHGITVYKCDRILAFNDCRSSLASFVRQYAGYELGREKLKAKHGPVALAAAGAKQPRRRDWRFLHLYLLLRIAREAALLDARLRRLMTPAVEGGVG